MVSLVVRLKLPRPYTTIVTHIEQHYAAEFGMPSTHATNSVVMPWFVVRAQLRGQGAVGRGAIFGQRYCVYPFRVGVGLSGALPSPRYRRFVHVPCSSIERLEPLWFPVLIVCWTCAGGTIVAPPAI
jgi:hypothetical protein